MSKFKDFLDGEAWSSQAQDDLLTGGMSLLSEVISERPSRALRLLGDPERARRIADAGVRDWRSAVRAPLEQELVRMESNGGEDRALAGRYRFLIEALLARQPKAAIGPLLTEVEYVKCMDRLRCGDWPKDALKGIPSARIVQQSLRPDLYQQSDDARRSAAALILSGVSQARGGAAITIAARLRLALVAARGSGVTVDGPFGDIKEAAEAIGRGSVERGCPLLFQPLDLAADALSSLQRPDLERFITFFGLPASAKEIATLLAIENRILRNELHDPWVRRHARLAASDHAASGSARGRWEGQGQPTRRQAIEELLSARCLDAAELRSLLDEDWGQGTRGLSSDFFLALLEDRLLDESGAAVRRQSFGVSRWFDHHLAHFGDRASADRFLNDPLPDPVLRSPELLAALRAHPRFEPFAARIEQEKRRRALAEMAAEAERGSRWWLFGYVVGLDGNRDRVIPRGSGSMALTRLVESCGRLESRWWMVDLTESDELWTAERAKAAGHPAEDRIDEIVGSIEGRILRSLPPGVRTRGEREVARCAAVVLGAESADQPPARLLAAFRAGNESEFIRLIEGEDTELPVARSHPRVFDKWWLLVACVAAVMILPGWVAWRNRPGGSPPAPPVPVPVATSGEMNPKAEGWQSSGNGWYREFARGDVESYGAFAAIGNDRTLRETLLSAGGDPDGQALTTKVAKALTERIKRDLVARFPIGLPTPTVSKPQEPAPGPRPWKEWRIRFKPPTQNPEAIVRVDLEPVSS